MEHLYIIAASESGPCKIGRSRPDIRRLSALQSGNPQPLKQFETFPLRSNSVLAERLAHLVLEDHRCNNVPKQREWFSVTVRQAAYVLNDIVRNVRALDKDDVVVSEVIVRTCGDSNCDYQNYWDWHDQNNDGDCPELKLPSHYLIKALTELPRVTHSFSFRDWLATLPEGYPFVSLEHDESRPKPNFKDLKGLLPTIRYLERKYPTRNFYYSNAWLSWCHGRDTDYPENEVLASFWNKFVPRWNRVNDNGYGVPQKGIDDTVNVVRLFCIEPNEQLGNGGYLNFVHTDFSVILKLPMEFIPIDKKVPCWEKLREVSLVNLRGFITPNLPKIWDNPFDNYIESQTGKMAKAFSEFASCDSNEFLDPRLTRGHYSQSNEATVLLSIVGPEFW